MAHELCIAKEMASLKIINLDCTICNEYTMPTIHDTQQMTYCEGTHERENEQEQDYIDSVQSSARANRNLMLDQAIDDGTQEF